MNSNNKIQETFVPFSSIINYVATSTLSGGVYFVYEFTRNVKQNIFYVNLNEDDL